MSSASEPAPDSARAQAPSPARSSGHDTESALIGAAAGAAAGAIIGHVTDRPGYCYARDQYGKTVVIQCPQGY